MNCYDIDILRGSSRYSLKIVEDKSYYENVDERLDRMVEALNW